MSQEDGDVTSHNPMLYDPLQDGVVKTSKTRQYLAALVSKCLSRINLDLPVCCSLIIYLCLF